MPTARLMKTRLDVLLVEKGLADSRNQAQALIMSGRVQLHQQVVTKVGLLVPSTAEVIVEQPLPYVSRGGFKLVAALESFGLDPTSMVGADVGASTGGFTDVLLQRGARRVYAIDVGYGQLAWKLRQDERVIIMERTNARYLPALPELIDLVTIDVSFISLTLILPVVKGWLNRPGRVVALVKPQFEAAKGQVGKKGIVRDTAIHQQVLDKVSHCAELLDFAILGIMPSPITGSTGNHEFLMGLELTYSVPKVKCQSTP